MAITNQERVGKALDLLRTEFAPFVAREQPASMKPRSSERGIYGCYFVYRMSW